MFLIKSSGRNIFLRDAGDGVMKHVQRSGTLFHKAPLPDPSIEILEISAADAKTFATKLVAEEREAQLAGFRGKVLAAKKVLAVAAAAAKEAGETVKKAEASVKSAEVELEAAMKALEPKKES